MCSISNFQLKGRERGEGGQGDGEGGREGGREQKCGENLWWCSISYINT